MQRSHPFDGKYVAILATAAGAILIVGWLARPRPIPESPPPVPTESELAQLARRNQRRTLESISDLFAGVARDVAPSLVYVPGAASTGVAWGGRIVTAQIGGQTVGSEAPVLAATGETQVRVGIAGHHVPLSTLEPAVMSAVSSEARAPETPARPGDWFLVAWRTAQNTPLFASGTLRQLQETTCGITPVREWSSGVALDAPMAGGGVFDINGGFLGMVLPCGDRLAIVDASSLASIVESAAAFDQQLLGRYGVLVAEPTDDEKKVLGLPAGVLIREVWSGEPADVAGLWPGDAITTLDGAPVASLEDLRPLISAGDQRYTLAVRRGPRSETVILPPAPGPGDEGSRGQQVGVVWESSSLRYRIDSVIEGSRAARAGLQPGDTLLRIDRATPRTLAALERILGGRSQMPHLVEIERGRRRIAVFIAGDQS